jgi:hypothetical protein
VQATFLVAPRRIQQYYSRECVRNITTYFPQLVAATTAASSERISRLNHLLLQEFSVADRLLDLLGRALPGRVLADVPASRVDRERVEDA